jgi:hypothetical protein
VFEADAMISCIDIQMKYTTVTTAMGILTVRLTEDEERMLTRRARAARLKRATYVRMLIREEPFVSAADVLADADKRRGDSRLRVRVSGKR